jgi:flagellar FliL protein
MAEQDNELEIVTDDKKKKILIIGGFVVATIMIIIGIVMFIVMSKDVNEDILKDGVNVTEVEAESEPANENRGTALYVAMPRPFVFNVPGQKRERLVQIKVQLMVRGGEDEDAAKTHIPLIEGTLLTVFSYSNADELVSEAGKTALRKQALREVQLAFQNIEGRKVVEQVLFTGFVMQ